MTVDELIEHVTSLASAQHGLVRVNQVRETDRGRLRHLSRRHVLQRVAQGVYRVAGSPETWEQRLLAGLWALGPTAIVSHASAARLHGFDRFDSDVIDYTVDRAHRGRRPSGIDCTVHTTSALPRSDIVSVDGIAVTSAARTILDLARAGAPTADVEAAIDSAIRLRLTTVGRLRGRVAEVRGSARWGVARLGELLETSGGHSFLEREFLRLVRNSGLPVPTPQVVHRKEGRHIARVDFLFERHAVVVEVSGGRGHSSARERAKDATRRNELQRSGRLVIEFTYEQVTRQPGLVVDTLRAVLGLPTAA